MAREVECKLAKEKALAILGWPWPDDIVGMGIGLDLSQPRDQRSQELGVVIMLLKTADKQKYVELLGDTIDGVPIYYHRTGRFLA